MNLDEKQRKRISEVKACLLEGQKKALNGFFDFENESRWLKDPWEKKPHEKLKGEGVSVVVERGETISKGGVNFSHVWGDFLPDSASALRPDLSRSPFVALGLSIVIHPKNPYVPTSHCNIRFFQAEKAGVPVWWFGGGFDLTPYYPFKEDVLFWHQEAKDLCFPFGDVYQKFKKNCDEYFYLKHRQEARGIGGIFFDDLSDQNGWTFEKGLSFVEGVCQTYLSTYLEILKKRYETPFSEKEKAFQLYRRGRYVEFNLLYDRGTLFGLMSGGRVESILMSLPDEVNWLYKEKKGSAEKNLAYYLKARDWLSD